MQILLCAATEMEIAPSIDFIKSNKIKEIDILISGIGVVATTYQLMKKIGSQKPDFILQAGIAGCVNNSLPLTKIVVVENETIGDLGVEENNQFLDLFQAGLLDKNSFPWNNGKLPNTIPTLKDAGLTTVNGVTVNEITTNKDRILYYKNELNADVETMEGAALHYVGLMEHIPFLQLRALSNFVGERDKNKWVMDIAIQQLNIELQRILTKFLPA